MKLPGPDHPISVENLAGRVVVRRNGEVVADTAHALALHEAGYPVVYYIPRQDAAMDLLQRTDHATHCPYKGDAAYFSFVSGGQGGDNAVWSYEQPYPAVAQIKDHLAFYPGRVEVSVD